MAEIYYAYNGKELIDKVYEGSFDSLGNGNYDIIDSTKYIFAAAAQPAFLVVANKCTDGKIFLNALTEENQSIIDKFKTKSSSNFVLFKKPKEEGGGSRKNKKSRKSRKNKKPRRPRKSRKSRR